MSEHSTQKDYRLDTFIVNPNEPYAMICTAEILRASAETHKVFKFRLRLQRENAKQCRHSIRIALCSHTQGVNLYFSENLCACSGNLCATIKRCVHTIVRRWGMPRLLNRTRNKYLQHLNSRLAYFSAGAKNSSRTGIK
jgi:hypothetical protein